MCLDTVPGGDAKLSATVISGWRATAEDPTGSLAPMHPISGSGSCAGQSGVFMSSLRCSSPQPDLGHLATESLGLVRGGRPRYWQYYFAFTGPAGGRSRTK